MSNVAHADRGQFGYTGQQEGLREDFTGKTINQGNIRGSGEVFPRHTTVAVVWRDRKVDPRLGSAN